MHKIFLLAAALSISACASRVETRLEFPPVADMKVDAEPAYPVAALDPCPSDSREAACPAEKAERQWWTDTLLWGRAHRDRVQRICKWARDLKAELPAGYCG